MVRVQLILIGMVCGLWMSLGSADGQPPHRPDGLRPNDRSHSSDSSREHSVFFEAMRELHRDSSNRELFDLLRDPKVRQEIHLSEADSEELDANAREAFQAIHAVRKASEDSAASKEELKQQIRAILDPLEASSFEILQKPEVDFKRLLGIYVQARSYRALLNDRVAEEIGLQGAALDDFRKFRSESWHAIMEDTRRLIEKEIRNTPPGSSPREAISVLFRRAEGKLDDKLASQLTEEQRANLEQLKGVKFELQPQPFSFPSGRRRGHAAPNDGR